MLWLFADCFSMQGLTLDVANWLRKWALWTAICPISGSSLSLARCWPFCLSSLCLLKVHMEISIPPPLLCVSFQFLVYCSVFFFCGVGGQSAQGAMLVCPRGGWGNTVWHLALTCLVCQMSTKQVWSWCLAAWEASCFLNVMWHGEALYGLGVQGV
jgi:hypothetical protein